MVRVVVVEPTQRHDQSYVWLEQLNNKQQLTIWLIKRERGGQLNVVVCISSNDVKNRT